MGSLYGPIPAEWTKYMTQNPALQLEEIPAVLWSSATYVSGTTRNLTFFDFAQGSRGDLTNMPTASVLPSPQAFRIESISLYVVSRPESDDSGAAGGAAIPSQFDDVVQILEGVCNLKIGNKQYGPWLGWMLPANTFVKGAFATGSDLLADYGQGDGFPYPLDPNLVIGPLQQFVFTMEWPQGALTLTTDRVIKVKFDGKMARSVQ